MNYLCVLGESIGHVSMLPALLELGSRTAAAGGDLEACRAPIKGVGGQAMAEPWRERPTSLKKKKELFSNSGKNLDKWSLPFSMVQPPGHNTRPTYYPLATPPIPKPLPAGPFHVHSTALMAWVLHDAPWPLAQCKHAHARTHTFSLFFSQNMPHYLPHPKAIVGNSVTY